MSSVHAPPAGDQSLASSSLTPPSSAGVVASHPVAPPQLAIRTDMVVLLSIAELGDRDLSGRTLWTAVELTPDEAAFVHESAINAEQGTAARLIGRFPKKSARGSG
jgi:hypothetical protein